MEFKKYDIEYTNKELHECFTQKGEKELYDYFRSLPEDDFRGSIMYLLGMMCASPTRCWEVFHNNLIESIELQLGEVYMVRDKNNNLLFKRRS